MCQRCRQRLLHDMVGMAGRGMREAAMRAAKTEKRARGQVGMSDARTHLPSPSMPLYTKSDTMSCHENAAGGAPPTEAMPMAAAGMAATRALRAKKKGQTRARVRARKARSALYKSEELLGRARCRVGGRGRAEQGRSGNRRDLGKKNGEHGTAFAWLAAFFQTTRPPWPSTTARSPRSAGGAPRHSRGRTYRARGRHGGGGPTHSTLLVATRRPLRCGLKSLVVVDVDCYKSSAEITLETILQMGGTDAFVVQTPRGGFHIYFKADDRMKPDAGGLQLGGLHSDVG